MMLDPNDKIALEFAWWIAKNCDAIKDAQFLYNGLWYTHHQLYEIFKSA